MELMLTRDRIVVEGGARYLLPGGAVAQVREAAPRCRGRFSVEVFSPSGRSIAETAVCGPARVRRILWTILGGAVARLG